MLAPYCAAFVHHGGAGTTHAALRAGLPSVVLPFIFEQQLWAKQLRRVGAAADSISFWKAQPRQVGAAIQRALASDALRERATDLAAAMSHEDGVGVAVQRLEQLLS